MTQVKSKSQAATKKTTKGAKDTRAGKLKNLRGDGTSSASVKRREAAKNTTRKVSNTVRVKGKGTPTKKSLLDGDRKKSKPPNVKTRKRRTKINVDENGRVLLSVQQELAVRLFSSGMSRTEVSRRVSRSVETVQNWFKVEPFIEALALWVEKRDAMFEAEMQGLVTLVGWRLRDILINGKNADALQAIDKILRLNKKYDDVLRVKYEKVSAEESEKDVDRYVEGLEQTYGVQIIEGTERFAKGEEKVS